MSSLLILAFPSIIPSRCAIFFDILSLSSDCTLFAYSCVVSLSGLQTTHSSAMLRLANKLMIMLAICYCKLEAEKHIELITSTHIGGSPLFCTI